MTRELTDDAKFSTKLDSKELIGLGLACKLRDGAPGGDAVVGDLGEEALVLLRRPQPLPLLRSLGAPVAGAGGVAMARLPHHC